MSGDPKLRARSISASRAWRKRRRLTRPVRSSVIAWRWTMSCRRALSRATAAWEASHSASVLVSFAKPRSGGNSTSVASPSVENPTPRESAFRELPTSPIHPSSPPTKICPPRAPVASVITSRITGNRTRGLCVAARASPTSASASRGSPCVAAGGRRRSLLVLLGRCTPSLSSVHTRSPSVRMVVPTASARNVQRTAATNGSVMDVNPAAPGRLRQH